MEIRCLVVTSGKVYGPFTHQIEAKKWITRNLVGEHWGIYSFHYPLVLSSSNKAHECGEILETCCK